MPRRKQTAFSKLSSKLKRKGVRNPNALAASIGRKKLGKKAFQARAAKGRRAAARRRKKSR